MRSSPERADAFAAIADPTRRALLVRLAEEGGKHVAELLEPLSISQPAVSKHLRVLREAGLVRVRKEGRRRLYEIEADGLRKVFDWVTHFDAYWDEKLRALGQHLNRQKRKRRTG